MFTLLSPAKKLLPVSKPYINDTTEPVLIKNALKLAKIMQTKSVEDIAQLMDLSRDLAVLNYDRYQQFHFKDVSVLQSYPAIYLFQGDVYQGLQANTWMNEDIDYAQSHLGILSGLYGLLRPLDRIQPYRLEMGVRLENPKGNNLYEFWREPITKALNEELASQANPVLINLASTEYFKAVDIKNIKYPIVTINFYERKNNVTKMIGIYAKKARGLMAKYLMQNKVDTLEQIKNFSDSGYRFNEQSSSEHHLDFIRDC
ncbi:peroxide stress protein YaaA [Legionella sp. km535]|uniref:peroxide stress protein YaaA n=1 Tax=Legionella sp. km535 TaxID=2498107 RepID=UPI000F8EA888|nr:peroxide stress protein YaaA [Legionella sp. km535]RUR19752.1 peroxide stress protein YaaA [Legionella sp. km535]